MFITWNIHPCISLHHHIWIFNCKKAVLEVLIFEIVWSNCRFCLTESMLWKFDPFITDATVWNKWKSLGTTSGECGWWLTTVWRALLWTPSQTKRNRQTHCSAEGSRILDFQCLMQNITNSFFVDFCQLNNSSNTHRILRRQFSPINWPFVLIIASVFDVQLRPMRASASVVCWPTLNFLGYSKTWLRNKHSCLYTYFSMN